MRTAGWSWNARAKRALGDGLSPRIVGSRDESKDGPLRVGEKRSHGIRKDPRPKRNVIGTIGGQHRPGGPPSDGRLPELGRPSILRSRETWAEPEFEGAYRKHARGWKTMSARLSSGHLRDRAVRMLD